MCVCKRVCVCVCRGDTCRVCNKIFFTSVFEEVVVPNFRQSTDTHVVLKHLKRDYSWFAKALTNLGVEVE